MWTYHSSRAVPDFCVPCFSFEKVIHSEAMCGCVLLFNGSLACRSDGWKHGHWCGKPQREHESDDELEKHVNYSARPLYKALGYATPVPLRVPLLWDGNKNGLPFPTLG